MDSSVLLVSEVIYRAKPLALCIKSYQIMSSLLRSSGRRVVDRAVWRQLSCPVRDNYDGRLGGQDSCRQPVILIVAEHRALLVKYAYLY